MENTIKERLCIEQLCDMGDPPHAKAADRLTLSSQHCVINNIVDKEFFSKLSVSDYRDYNLLVLLNGNKEKIQKQVTYCEIVNVRIGLYIPVYMTKAQP